MTERLWLWLDAQVLTIRLDREAQLLSPRAEAGAEAAGPKLAKQCGCWKPLRERWDWSYYGPVFAEGEIWVGFVRILRGGAKLLEALLSSGGRDQTDTPRTTETFTQKGKGGPSEVALL